MKKQFTFPTIRSTIGGGVMLVHGTLCGRPSSLHKHTQKGKTDANGRTQKSKRTRTDALRTQNGRKRTGTHIKTDASDMYGPYAATTAPKACAVDCSARPPPAPLPPPPRLGPSLDIRWHQGHIASGCEGTLEKGLRDRKRTGQCRAFLSATKIICVRLPAPPPPRFIPMR